MISDAKKFFSTIDNPGDKSLNDIVEIFVYYLNVHLEKPTITPREVNECFLDCDLTPPKNTSATLSRGVNSKPQRYVKVQGGYRLQGLRRDAIAKTLGAEKLYLETSAELRKLESSFPDGYEKRFLKETVDCFEIGANRAAIIMCWLLTLNHMYEFVLKNKVLEFNRELSKLKDKRIRVSSVSIIDDFSEIPENKFIELLRSSGVVSNDVRKILDTKLGIRNSCAHPSGIEVGKIKALEFINDLVINVIQKY